MTPKAYRFLVGIIWKLSCRLARYEIARNKAKLGAAAAIALVVIGGILASRAGDED